MLFGYSQQRLLKLNQQLSNFSNLTLHIHMHIQRNLVVTAACGMQTSTGAADALRQTCLHIHVNVLESNIKMEVASLDISQNILQSSDDFFPVLCWNDSAFCQHTGMGNTAADILVI